MLALGTPLPEFRLARVAGGTFASTDFEPQPIVLMVLCEMLTYNDGAPFLVRSSAVADGVERYLTPVPEFLVDKVELAEAQAALLPSSPFASILLVVDGEGTLDEYGPGSEAGAQQHSLSAGSVFVMYAWTKVRVASQSRLLAFRATSRYILEEADR